METQKLSLTIPKITLADADRLAEKTGIRRAQILRDSMALGLVRIRDFARTTEEKENDQPNR